jgi:hypothetical protein
MLTGRFVLTGLLLLGLAGTGCSGPQTPAVGEIVQSGLCVQGPGGRYSQPQSTAGYATDCYALSEKFELVPGTWTLSVLYRGSLLVRQSFYVHDSE